MDIEDRDALDAVERKLARAHATPGAPITDMRLRLDVRDVLKRTLLNANIPASRLTDKWSPADDHNPGGWRLRLQTFAAGIRGLRPAYADYIASTNHADDTFGLKLPDVRRYLVERVREALT